MIPPEAPKSVADMIRARFGLDQPVYIQYLRWLQAMASGDLGTSIFTNQPVAGELLEYPSAGDLVGRGSPAYVATAQGWDAPSGGGWQ